MTSISETTIHLVLHKWCIEELVFVKSSNIRKSLKLKVIKVVKKYKGECITTNLTNFECRGGPGDPPLTDKGTRVLPSERCNSAYEITRKLRGSVAIARNINMGSNINTY